MSETPLLDRPGDDPDLIECLSYLGKQHDRLLAQVRNRQRDNYGPQYIESLTEAAERFGRRFDAVQRALDIPEESER